MKGADKKVILATTIPQHYGLEVPTIVDEISFLARTGVTRHEVDIFLLLRIRMEELLDDAYKSTGNDPEAGLAPDAVTKLISNVYQFVDAKAEPIFTGITCTNLSIVYLPIAAANKSIVPKIEQDPAASTILGFLGKQFQVFAF